MELPELDLLRQDASRWRHVWRQAKRIMAYTEMRWSIIASFPDAETIDAAVDAEIAEEAKRQGGS